MASIVLLLLYVFVLLTFATIALVENMVDTTFVVNGHVVRFPAWAHNKTYWHGPHDD
jgi:uncharacterized membrane protein YagU involved in acid resistance